MAKTNNPGITSNDIQNTKDYADALDKLQDSLNGVNSAFSEFSNGVN